MYACLHVACRHAFEFVDIVDTMKGRTLQLRGPSARLMLLALSLVCRCSKATMNAITQM